MAATTLTVWHYDSAMGAAAGEVRLKDLQQQGGLRVIDAVTVAWLPGSDEPRVGHLARPGGKAVAKGSVLGALVGTLFLAPVVGAAAGAGVGAIAHRLRDTGIDEEFLNEIKTRVTPGTSALLILSSDADLEVVRTFIERGLARGDVTLMHAQLSDTAPDALKDLLQSVSGDTPGIARSGGGEEASGTPSVP
jgi:uncharacterized membrane protein